MEELNTIIQKLIELKENASYHNLSGDDITNIDAAINQVEKLKKKEHISDIIIELLPFGTVIGKILLEIFKDSS